MLIKSLDIVEFRGIKRLFKPINFTKFNIIIGRNNSGKTTILDALSLLPHAMCTLPDGYPSDIYTRFQLLSKLRCHDKTNSRYLVYLYDGQAIISYQLYDKYSRAKYRKIEIAIPSEGEVLVKVKMDENSSIQGCY